MKIYFFKSYDEENNDFELEKAQLKITINYKSPEEFTMPKIDSILRIRFPFNRDEEEVLIFYYLYFI